MRQVKSHGPGSGAPPTAPMGKPANSHGPGSGAPPTARPGGGGFDPRAFAKMLNPEQRKDFQALGRNTKGDYMGWGKNAAKGGGLQHSPEEMLRRRYKLGGGGGKTAGPKQVAPTPPSGPPVGAGGPGPAGGGGGATGGGGGLPSASGAPLAGLLQAGGMPMAPPPILPQTPPGLRQGLGMRQHPTLSSPLAGLQRIY